MDRSAVIYLLKEENVQNDDGTWSGNLTKRKVYAQVASITRSEWFEGRRNGLNGELKFTMFAPDYHDEEILEHNSKRYTIYRTYVTDDENIELYVERRKGTEDGNT